MTEQNKIQITINNFQSIKKAELEFISGINLIVGEGNSGKSATLRAIKSAILNPKGNKGIQFIRQGTPSLSVELKYLNNDIEWIRSKKDSKYIINGEEYQKVGNSNLSKILDKSGFVLDDNDKLMNVEGELELPFPFDKNPTDLFKLFEKSIFCVSDSALILKNIKADEDTANKDKVNAKHELDRYNKKLIALDELFREIDLEILKNGKIKLEELFFQYDKLLNNINLVTKSIQAINDLKNLKAEVKQPDFNLYLKLVKDIEKLDNIQKIRSVLEVTKPSISCSINLDEYIKLNIDVKKLEDIYKIIVSNKETKKEIVTKLNIDDYIKLNKDYKKVINIIKRLKVLTSLLNENNIQKDNLKKELSTFKVCPLCHQEIKQEN